MPSFDIVSEIDQHELTNAVDQANREVGTRFDFKGTDSKFTLKDNVIEISTESDFQLKQMKIMLDGKLTKRGIDISCLEVGEPDIQMKTAKQTVKIKSGVDQPSAKKIIKLIKDEKMKVQTQIQGEQIRVTGKKRDDLQAVIALLEEANTGIPLQFDNFRD